MSTELFLLTHDPADADLLEQACRQAGAAFDPHGRTPDAQVWGCDQWVGSGILTVRSQIQDLPARAAVDYRPDGPAKAGAGHDVYVCGDDGDGCQGDEFHLPPHWARVRFETGGYDRMARLDLLTCLVAHVGQQLDREGIAWSVYDPQQEDHYTGGLADLVRLLEPGYETQPWFAASALAGAR